MKRWTPLQPVTREQASRQFLEYLASLEREIAAGGGGGGATWGGITGTLSSQTDLQTALNGKAATVHTHAQSDVTGLVAALAGKSDTGHTHTASAVTDFSEAVDDRVAALLTAGTNITLTYNDGAGTLTIAAAGGSGLSGLATVTVPNNSLQWSETVAATGVTGSSRILLSIAPHDDADENDAEMLDVSAMSAAPGTGQITVEMAFSAPTAGPIKLNWVAV